MNTNEIIRELSLEIARLQEARAILASQEEVAPTEQKQSRVHEVRSVKRGRPPGKKAAPTEVPKPARRALSDEARARIAAAQQKRWAKVKKAAKIAARKTTVIPKTNKKITNDTKAQRVAAKPPGKRTVKGKPTVKAVGTKRAVAPRKTQSAKAIKPAEPVVAAQQASSETAS